MLCNQMRYFYSFVNQLFCFSDVKLLFDQILPVVRRHLGRSAGLNRAASLQTVHPRLNFQIVARDLLRLDFYKAPTQPAEYIRPIGVPRDSRSYGFAASRFGSL